jgi:hypothetical protein
MILISFELIVHNLEVDCGGEGSRNEEAENLGQKEFEARDVVSSIYIQPPPSFKIIKPISKEGK